MKCEVNGIVLLLAVLDLLVYSGVSRLDHVGMY